VCRSGLVFMTRFAFQACSFNHSDISPYRINDLRTPISAQNANCVRPPNVLRSLTATHQYRTVGKSPACLRRGPPASYDSTRRRHRQTKRCHCMDRRALPALRPDRKVPANNLQPLLHARQAEPTPSQRFLGVKAGARILDCEIDGVGLTVQRDVSMTDPLCLTTFCRASCKTR